MGPIPDYSAGSAYLQIIPNLTGGRESIQGQLDRAIDGVDAKVNVAAELDRTAIEKIDAALSSIPDVKVTADTTEADAKIAELRGRLTELRDKRIGVDVDAATALAELSDVREQLDEVALRHPNVQVQADISAASSALEEVKAKADELAAKHPNVQASADTAEASAKIDQLSAKLDEFGSKSVTAKANVDTGSGMSSISGLAAALVALGGPIGGAVMGLGALASAGVTGIAGLGALKLATSGVGGALTALSQAQDQAASSTAQDAAKQVSSANSVANAQDAVKKAVEGVADTERNSANSIISAREAVANAVQAESDARRSAAQGVQSALESLQQAEESLQQAEESELRAQQALSDARDAAARQLENYKTQMQDAALAERSATLSVQQALVNLQQVQANPASTQIQREQAQLTYDQAVQQVTDVKQKNQELAADKAKADAQGVDGSRQVVAAQDSLIQAQRQVADATRAVGDAHQKVSDAQIKGAEQVAKAQQAVGDADRALTQAQINGARQVEQAQQAVVQAQRALQGALAQSGTQGQQAADKVKTAFQDLSPAAADFARYLFSLKPEFDNLKAAAANGALPGIKAGIEALNPLTGELTQNVGRLGIGIGSFFQTIGQGLAAPYWSQFFSTISNAGVTLFPQFASTLLTVGRGFADLTQALLPAAPAALSVVSDLGSLLSAISPVVGQISGPLIGSLHQFVDMLKANLGPTLAALAPALVSISSVFTNSLGGSLQILTVTLGALNTPLRLLADLLNALPAPVEAVVVAGALLAKTLGPSKLLGALSLLNPASKQMKSAMSDMSDSLSNVGYKAGSSVEKLTGWSGAAEKGYSAGSKFASGLSKIGSTLPLIGAAITGVIALNDAFTTSQDDATAAVLKGGQAADDARAAAAAQSDGLENSTTWLGKATHAADEWTSTNIWGQATTENVTAALAKQRAGMTDVQRAQQDATVAQGNYQQAVDRFGQGSPQAVAAQGALATATDHVKQAQDAAATATENATQKLQDQQDKELASVNAGLAQKQSLHDVKQAQDDLATAIQQHGKSSDEAQSADLRLQQSQAQYVQSSEDAAVAEAKRNGVVDTSIARTKAHDDALMQLANDSKGPLSDALKQQIQDMGAARLSSEGARLSVDGLGNEIATLPDGHQVVISADTAPAAQKLKALTDLINGAVGTIKVNANGQPADDKTRTTLNNINTSIGTLHIDGDPGPGDGSLHDLVGRINATRQAMHIEGDPLPAHATTDQTVQWIGRQTGTLQARANTDPAQTDVNTFKGAVPTQPPAQIPMGANYAPAKQDTGGFWNWLKGLFGFGGGPSAPPPPPSGPVFAGAFAAGGPVGPVASSDTVPAMLTPGEIVFSKPAVDAIGAGPLLALHRALTGAGGGAVTATGVQGMATGGVVVGLAAGGPVPSTGSSAGGDAAPQLTALGQAMSGAVAGGMKQLLELLPLLTSGFQTNTEQVKLAQTQDTEQVTRATTAMGAQWAATRDVLLPSVTAGFHQNSTAIGDAQRQNTTAVTDATRLQGEQFAFAENVQLPDLTGSFQRFQNAHRDIWTQIQSMTRGSIDFITNRFYPDLKSGNTSVGQSFSDTAQWIQRSWSAIEGYARDPVKYVVNTVYNQGIIPAWNNLDAFFALGKHVNAAGTPFASGGPVGGTGAGDTVPAMLTPGEYVLPKAVVDTWGMGNIAAAHQAALSARGFAAGGPVFPTGTPPDMTYQNAHDLIAQIVPRFGGVGGQASGAVEGAAQSNQQISALGQVLGAVVGATIGPLSGNYVQDIINAAKAKGIGHAGAVIAVMTALAESGLRMYANINVPASLGLPHEAVGHDHDSVGLFQQRQSWGPTALLMNPFGSAELFFNKLGPGPYGDFGAEAQRVQVSAFPGAYDPFRGQAEALVASHGYDTGGYLPPGLTLAYNATGKPEPVLTPAQLAGVASGAASGASGGSFVGTLTLDNGAFIGQVEGVINQANADQATALAGGRRV